MFPRIKKLLKIFEEYLMNYLQSRRIYDRQRQRGLFVCAVFSAASILCASGIPVRSDEIEKKEISTAEPLSENAHVRQRLRESVEFLSSAELEGRGPGSRGIETAAEWVAKEFAAIGLSTQILDNGPFQPFTMTLETKLGEQKENTAELVGPADGGGEKIIPLVLSSDWTPLAAGGSGAFEIPLAFAGYGITARIEEYDDYASLIARGKAIIILRHEPQQENPHSVFDGNENSQYAALSRKIANASEHEAGAVLFVNDSLDMRRNQTGYSTSLDTAVREVGIVHDTFLKNTAASSEVIEKYRVEVGRLANDIRKSVDDLAGNGDTLMGFDRAGDGSDHRSMPVLQIRRNVIDQVITQSTGHSIEQLESEIDKELKPQSIDLAGWKIRGRISTQRVEAASRNVLGLLKGQGEFAGETVVLGAHYDHLGFGGVNSAAPGETAIHHGADDNASGTAMLVEVARRLVADGPLPRSVLFIAFSGEERGLLGSAHYVDHPLVPLNDTVAMVNLDMVGRLDSDKLIVHGTGTSTRFEELVDQLAEQVGFELAKEPGGFGPSDHSTFYAKKIPVLHLFTGSHPDYHRPTDTAEKINYDGMVRIADMVAAVVKELATQEKRPDYIEVASKQFVRGGGDRPYFGSIPDFGKPQKGYAISGVSKDSPAQRGGLLGGDVIVRLGESAVTGLEDFDSALRKIKAGEKVPVIVLRNGETVTLEVIAGAPR